MAKIIIIPKLDYLLYLPRIVMKCHTLPVMNLACDSLFLC